MAGETTTFSPPPVEVISRPEMLNLQPSQELVTPAETFPLVRVADTLQQRQSESPLEQRITILEDFASGNLDSLAQPPEDVPADDIIEGDFTIEETPADLKAEQPQKPPETIIVDLPPPPEAPTAAAQPENTEPETVNAQEVNTVIQAEIDKQLDGYLKANPGMDRDTARAKIETKAWDTLVYMYPDRAQQMADQGHEGAKKALATRDRLAANPSSSTEIKPAEKPAKAAETSTALARKTEQAVTEVVAATNRINETAKNSSNEDVKKIAKEAGIAMEGVLFLILQIIELFKGSMGLSNDQMDALRDTIADRINGKTVKKKELTDIVTKAVTEVTTTKAPKQIEAEPEPNVPLLEAPKGEAAPQLEAAPAPAQLEAPQVEAPPPRPLLLLPAPTDHASQLPDSLIPASQFDFAPAEVAVDGGAGAGPASAGTA